MSYPDELFDLQDKVALITGGAGLLGQEYTKVLSDAGARVILFDIREGFAVPPGVNGSYVKVDITNRDAVFAAVAEIAKDYDRIDVLVNNAAMDPKVEDPEAALQFAPYEEYPRTLWEREFAVGLGGALFCTQAVVPVMKRQGSGSIINISSTYGNVGPDNRIYAAGKFKSIGYATMKGGIINFTRAWASYLRSTGIRVNTLTLGGVYANQPDEFVKAYADRTILGRMADKSDYNGAILFLASDASGYMTGANLIVDGGWTAV